MRKTSNSKIKKIRKDVEVNRFSYSINDVEERLLLNILAYSDIEDFIQIETSYDKNLNDSHGFKRGNS